MQDLANAWRTAQDGQANWQSIMQSVDDTEPLWPLAGPSGPIGGHWNDADMIEAGNVGLSAEEARTQVALWAVMNMPMLLSNDLRKFARKRPMTAIMPIAGSSSGGAPTTGSSPSAGDAGSASVRRSVEDPDAEAARRCAIWFRR